MLNTLAKKVFGSRNERIVKSYRGLVQEVNALEERFAKMNDAEVRGLTASFRERLAQGEPLESLKAEAFAAVREASKRTLGMRHFDVQIIGGAVLHSGAIAEMRTGEGKTLCATLPAYLNALPGKGVHIVTVNDYLARRDAEWMGRVYDFLGLSIGVIYSGMPEGNKKSAYEADITYGQNNEFGFDYLRDNMKFSLNRMMQRGHTYAIVDEVDSILIDEARTPLIISGPAEDATELYATANAIVPKFKAEEDFDIDLKSKRPALTEAGVAHAEKLLGIDNLYDPKNIDILHHVHQALRAHNTLEIDVDYVVRDGQVIIVDEFTGRLMPGRRWSDGLHQAIEAKEGLVVARENQTLASITFQNFFRMYDKLAGMTGTADTEAIEFKQIYKLDVVVIPTNMPMLRDDQSDVVFRSRKEKYEAVVEDIAELHQTGQPVLVGTISIEQSETLSKYLQRKDIPHNVLNAKQHEREAEIVSQAGRFGAVTIATNMAGRGTDIMLGGNPEFLAIAEFGSKDFENPEFQKVHEDCRRLCEEEKEKVRAAGGLFIMGTERHESRRIDNQLRGRSGRQGDPGVSRFYISLEDDLMARFGGERLQQIMQRLGWEEGAALDGRLISRTIENAQRRVEGFHYESRKHVTEYDDVMNKQRQVVYNLRRELLEGKDTRERVYEMMDDLFEAAVIGSCDEKQKPSEWDMKALAERYAFITRFPPRLPQPSSPKDRQLIFDELRKQAKAFYEKRIGELDDRFAKIASLNLPIRISESEDKPLAFSTIEQDSLIETLDHYWNLHLQEMDNLREGIGLRGYGQMNPKNEYQREGFLLFQGMFFSYAETALRKLFYYEVPQPEELVAAIQAEQERRAQVEKQMQLVHDGEEVKEEGAHPTPDQVRSKLQELKKARRKKAR